MALAQDCLTDPAARPVFNEWFESVPRGVLQNLAYFLLKLPPAKLAAQSQPCDGKVINELESAIEQVAGLYELMEHQVLNPPDGEMAEHLKCGVVELASATFNRLRQASEAVNTLATLKGGAR